MEDKGIIEEINAKDTQTKSITLLVMTIAGFGICFLAGYPTKAWLLTLIASAFALIVQCAWFIMERRKLNLKIVRLSKAIEETKENPIRTHTNNPEVKKIHRLEEELLASRKKIALLESKENQESHMNKLKDELEKRRKELEHKENVFLTRERIISKKEDTFETIKKHSIKLKKSLLNQEKIISLQSKFIPNPTTIEKAKTENTQPSLSKELSKNLESKKTESDTKENKTNAVHIQSLYKLPMELVKEEGRLELFSDLKELANKIHSINEKINLLKDNVFKKTLNEKNHVNEKIH